MNAGHWQVSTEGGTRPLWSGKGDELFFLSPAGQLMRVAVERGAPWIATTPSMILKEGDVSPDGRRFLMMKAAGSDGAAALPSMIVVQHWDEELKAACRPVDRGSRVVLH